MQATWRAPATLLSVNVQCPATQTTSALPAETAADIPMALPWLACELASRQLPLTDPLQNDLADAVLALREQLLQSAAWKDERPRDESTVTRLDRARPVKA